MSTRFVISPFLTFSLQGFTAWSSQREPAQVFTLLEKLYGAFDEISKRHGVFKVETVSRNVCQEVSE